MAKQKQGMFWLAAGVVQIDGEEYGADEPLPISKIPKATLDRWIASGKVGGKIQAVGPDAVLKNLQEELAELRKQAVDDAAKIAELEKQVESLTTPGADDKKDGGK